MSNAIKNLGIVAVLPAFFMILVTTAHADPTEKNKQEGLAFLAENAKKEGVKESDSGLQYLVLEQGTGRSPGARDQVTVNYRGTSISGVEFDSGSGVSFPLAGVIRGWTEGLQLMREGAKFRFFIPPQLAYGERGAGDVIGPNQTLVFDVELLNVNP